jgi:hypothetical protein
LWKDLLTERRDEVLEIGVSGQLAVLARECDAHLELVANGTEEGQDESLSFPDRT